MKKSRHGSRTVSELCEEIVQPHKNQNQIENNRIIRHEKLIEMIQRFTRTHQDEEKVKKMKKNTEAEIDIRYRSSKQKGYIFPRIEEEVDIEDSPRKKTRNIYYDLHSQNEIIREPTQTEFMELSRRVKSLDEVNKGVQSEKIIKGRKILRLQTDLDNQIFPGDFGNRKKRSKTLVKQTSSQRFALPILSIKIPKLKTDINNPISKMKVENLVMKKLATQAYNPIQESQLRNDFRVHLKKK